MTAISAGGKRERKRRIPRTLDICGLTYRVREERDPKADGRAADGFCHPRSQLIILRRGLHPESLRSTLLHEIIEAVNVTYCLHLPHRAIELLEVGLYQALKANRLRFW